MRYLLSVLLLAASLGADAGSLERLDQVDLIELEVGTGRALLVVLLEEDRINTKPAMKAVFQKVNNYLGFAASGQLKIAAPNASDSLAPKIVVYGPRDATSAEMQNLAGLKLAGKKASVEVEVHSFKAGIRPRPVAFTPAKRSGA